jgi:hypothetical protein
MVEGVALDFDFSRSHAPLRPITNADVAGGVIENSWTALYLFGLQNYDGGASAYLGVHRDTGEICGLDVEREKSQVFLLNSDIDRFIRTFQRTDELLRSASLAPGALSRELRVIDPDAFQRSDWRDFADYIEKGG